MRTPTDRLLMLANRILISRPDYGKLYEKYRLEYYQEHREELIENSRRYYAEHKEECIKTVREWQRNNAEKVKANRRQWKKDHWEYCKEARKKWRKENPLTNKEFTWKYNDKMVQTLREKSAEYIRLHPELKEECAKKWRENHREEGKIHSKSNRLYKAGVIVKVPCKCGADSVMMRQIDYKDAMNVEWCCKECGWKKIKERNRQKKIDLLKKI